jgi:hypothetical protein
MMCTPHDTCVGVCAVLFDAEESMVATSRADKAAIKPLLADANKSTLQVSE